MSRPLNRRLLAGLGIALALISLFAINSFGALVLRPYRLDLTETKTYTLSEGTLKLLASLEEPIVLRLYVSGSIAERHAFLAAYARRVHDMLRAYAEASGGKITVELIDPEPYSEEEDRAVGFGLQPITLDNGQTVAYLGVAGTNSTDDVDVIPLLSPERETFLEYDLTRLVYNLAHPEKPKIGMVSGLPLSGDPLNEYRPWEIYRQLGQLYDIRWMGGDISEFEDVDILMIVHPQSLSDKTLYAIDQFLLRGGKAMVFVDPHSEAAALRQPRPGMGSTSSNLEKLFAAWGVSFDAKKVVADPTAARQVQYPSGNRTQIVDYLVWLSLGRHHFAADSPITGQLRRVNVATAGAIAVAEGSGLTFEPLLFSSRQAQLVDVDRVNLFPDPLALLRDWQPEDHVRVIAARLSGTLKSAFADGPPAGVESQAEHLSEGRGPATLIVVADTDLLDDRSWLATQTLLGQEILIPVADNADFIANALDHLVGSGVFADLRGRDVALRPFTRLVELRREAEQAYRAKEQELLDRLKQLEDKLRALQLPAGEGEAVLSADQREEIAKIRADILETRRELREVQYALRRDIETLQAGVRFVNIAAVPLLVALAAVVIALIRRARFRQRVAVAAS
jgi:ABC-type uncharacterized transport system involved in gliding motility auxiliary subunit